MKVEVSILRHKQIVAMAYVEMFATISATCKEVYPPPKIYTSPARAGMRPESMAQRSRKRLYNSALNPSMVCNLESAPCLTLKFDRRVPYLDDYS
jgi:hypothetical protein